jgi:microcystin degradation protein MlrC
MPGTILTGSIVFESNSFSPIMTGLDDFCVTEPADYLKSSPVTELFRRADFDVLPTIGATALSSGKMEKRCFDYLSGRILAPADENKEDIVGVWLYLHGAMEVEGMGSAELSILKSLREILGPEIPVAVAMDFHASLPDEIVDYCDILTAYKTAPHTDQADTQMRAANLLIRTLAGEIDPQLMLIRVPAIVDGNFVLTDIEPQKGIMAAIEDREKGNILAIAFFACNPWINTDYNSATVFVTYHQDKDEAETAAADIARMYWDNRNNFAYYGELLSPRDTISCVQKHTNEVIFVSDSGDNPGAGAPGDSIFFLSELLDAGVTDVLVAHVYDPAFVQDHAEAALGGEVAGVLGDFCTRSGNKLNVTAKVLHRGDVPPTEGLVAEPEGMGHGCQGILIDIDGVHVIVTDQRVMFTSRNMFTSFGVDLHQYRVAVFKMGYLLPDLQPLPDRSIYALTRGATSTVLEEMPFNNIFHPLFPFDKDFQFEPECRISTIVPVVEE